jgi:hypothetical protein
MPPRILDGHVCVVRCAPVVPPPQQPKPTFRSETQNPPVVPSTGPTRSPSPTCTRARVPTVPRARVAAWARPERHAQLTAGCPVLVVNAAVNP